MSQDIEATLKDLRAELAELRKVLLAQTHPELATRLTVDEAAGVLHCSRETVYRLLKAGQLKRAAKVGKETLVTWASVQAVLDPPVAGPKKPRSPRPRTDADELEAIRALKVG